MICKSVRMHTALKTAELKKEEKQTKPKINWTCLLKEGTNQTKTQGLVFPFKGRCDLKKVPPADPPLSDMDPTLTYCGGEDLVTTTLPR